MVMNFSIQWLRIFREELALHSPAALSMIEVYGEAIARHYVINNVPHQAIVLFPARESLKGIAMV